MTESQRPDISLSGTVPNDRGAPTLKGSTASPEWHGLAIRSSKHGALRGSQDPNFIKKEEANAHEESTLRRPPRQEGESGDGQAVREELPQGGDVRQNPKEIGTNTAQETAAPQE